MLLTRSQYFKNEECCFFQSSLLHNYLSLSEPFPLWHLAILVCAEISVLIQGQLLFPSRGSLGEDSCKRVLSLKQKTVKNQQLGLQTLIMRGGSSMSGFPLTPEGAEHNHIQLSHLQSRSLAQRQEQQA